MNMSVHYILKREQGYSSYGVLPTKKNKLILSLKVLNSNTLPHSDDIAKILDIRAYEMRF